MKSIAVYSIFLLLASRVALLSQTTTVSVSGVVVGGKSGNARAANIRLKLKTAIELARDKTAANGVYNLTSKGSIDKTAPYVYVCVDESSYDETWHPVKLESETGGVRRAKATDLRLFRKTRSGNDSSRDVALRFANALHAENLKVSLGISTQAKATESIRKKTGAIFAAYPSYEDSHARSSIIRQAEKILEKYPDKESVLRPTFQPSQLTEFMSKKEFRLSFDSEKKKIDEFDARIQDFLRSGGPFREKDLIEMLSLPMKDIKVDWLIKHGNKDQMAKIYSLQKDLTNQGQIARGNTNVRRGGSPAERRARADRAAAEARRRGPTDKELKDWLSKNPAIRERLLLQKVSGRSELSEKQKSAINRRLQRPAIR